MATSIDSPRSALRRLEEPSLGADELDSIVRAAISGADDPAGDSEVARLVNKLGWVDVLIQAAGRSDQAVERLVEALADTESYDLGTSPYDAYHESVGDRALSGLFSLDARKRALESLLRFLARTESSHGRKNAARVLEWIGPAAKDAIPLLEKLVDDPEVLVRAAARFAIERITGNT